MKIIAVVLLLAMALDLGLGLSLKKNDVAKSKDDLISQRQSQRHKAILQELDEKADKITAELKAWFEQGKQEFYKLELPCFKNSEDDFPLCLKEILPFVRFDYYGDNRHGAHSGSEKSETTPMTTAPSTTTTIATPATTERMADQWAKKFEQLGITDDESILNERWANLGLDPFLLKSTDDREHEPLKKIEVVF